VSAWVATIIRFVAVRAALRDHRHRRGNRSAIAATGVASLEREPPVARSRAISAST